MENYMKGKNVEAPDAKENIPIGNLPEDFVWIKVQGGSKLRNLLDPCIKAVQQQGLVLISGSGPGLTKAISCAEIVKRRYRGLKQISQIKYRTVEEHWDPKTEELDPLKVVREIPQIYILLAKTEPIKELDVPSATQIQTNNSLDKFLKVTVTKKKTSSRAAADLGLENKKKKSGAGQNKAPR